VFIVYTTFIQKLHNYKNNYIIGQYKTSGSTYNNRSLLKFNKRGMDTNGPTVFLIFIIHLSNISYQAISYYYCLWLLSVIYILYLLLSNIVCIMLFRIMINEMF